MSYCRRHFVTSQVQMSKQPCLAYPTCDAPHERDANRTRYPGGAVVQGRPYINDGHTSLLSKYSFLRCDELHLQVWLVVRHTFDFEMRRARMLGSDLLIL